MHIRRATQEHVTAISHILAASWKSGYRGLLPQSYLDEIADDRWVDIFTQWMESGRMTTLLACDELTTVGCVAYGASREEALSGWGEIVVLYLLPDYFGSGCAGMLMEAALADLQAQGYRDVYLWVLDTNWRARRFYEKCGFRCNQELLTFELAGETFHDVRYIRSLDAPKADLKSILQDVHAKVCLPHSG